MQDYDDMMLRQHAVNEAHDAALAQAFDDFHSSICAALKRELNAQLMSGSFMSQTVTVGDDHIKEAEVPAYEIFIDCVLLDTQNSKLLSELLASPAADKLRIALAHAYAEKEGYPIARARSTK